VATFHKLSTALNGPYCSREKELLTQPPARLGGRLPRARAREETAWGKAHRAGDGGLYRRGGRLYEEEKGGRGGRFWGATRRRTGGGGVRPDQRATLGRQWLGADGRGRASDQWVATVRPVVK
jgi:hypothetical protein